MLKMSGHEHFTDSTEDFGAVLSEQGRRNTTALHVGIFLFCVQRCASQPVTPHSRSRSSFRAANKLLRWADFINARNMQ